MSTHQSLAVVSHEHVTANPPQGENLASMTVSVWPRKIDAHAPEVMHQSLAVLSPEAVKQTSSLGEHATAQTSLGSQMW